MTDRPILFSGPMVRALLEGRKTQTRRVITNAAADDMLAVFGPKFLELPGNRDVLPIRAILGDRLWVREAWRTSTAYDDLPPRDMGGDEPIKWEADHSIETWGWSNFDWCEGRFRQGMHMPRWASRLTLIVTDVRVQRVQEIGEADAKSEGVFQVSMSEDGRSVGWKAGYTAKSRLSARMSFRDLWDDLNALRGFGWSENPWVAAYTFTVHRQNIDNVGEAV